MALKIAYQSVWDQTLTKEEKLKYESHLAQCIHKEATIFASPIVVKEKKNKGVVATTFICNNSDNTFPITSITVELRNDQLKLVAQEDFHLLLEIPPFSAMPWSFVFDPANVKIDVSTVETFTIQYSLNDDEMD